MRLPLALLTLAASALSVRAAKDVVTVTAEKVRPARPHIPNRTFSLADFGAVGDGQTLNTGAFQAAIAAVNRAGGGTLIVPAGTYLTRPFVLCSKLNLHLEEGAVIAAPRTFTEAGMPEPETMHSQAEAKEKENKPEPLITANDVDDLELTGTGTIDGNGAHWWAWSERAGRAQPGRVVYSRPNLVEINGCERLLVSGLTFLNSSRYHLKAENVTDVTVDAVTIQAPSDAPNTDGIDIGPGRNFLVRNCHCDTGDDDICIKGGGVNV
ncbi:MAG TPA: glycosyl hydrolase family 28 protein, partial [Opitutaceae bacterium]|nr:glycosyl hydrolase family 28 protein [Opitutaceae bacterium]